MRKVVNILNDALGVLFSEPVLAGLTLATGVYVCLRWMGMGD